MHAHHLPAHHVPPARMPAVTGRRGEDRARRAAAAGMLVALLPLFAVSLALSIGAEMPQVVLVTMLAIIAAAALVGLVMRHVARGMLAESRRSEAEQRRW